MDRSFFDLPSVPDDWASFQIRSALEDTVLKGGKRFRPQLVFLMGRALGLSEKDLRPFARTAELTHAATLAHDDVVDEATTRRGRPSLNRSFSNAHAVLAGDFLLARAVSEIVGLGNLDVLSDLARVIESLCEGEWLQLESRGVVANDFRAWENIALRKTSSLICWCLITPARVFGSTDKKEISALQDCGEALGLAFQMRDDILDFDASLSGKDELKDWNEGLLNSVTVQMLCQNVTAEGPKALGRWKKAMDERTRLREVPWTSQQRDFAVGRVRDRIQIKILVARQRLSDFVTLVQARTGRPLDASAIAEIHNGMSLIEGNQS
ncbi:MAG: polyprenyl synthetase family protein [Bdellovibrionales bacterium]|nr:polyprenyl synthetase family protein [Bdellovibrionales bacterium]